MEILSYSFAAVYGVELSFSLNDYSSLVTCQMLFFRMVLLHKVTFCSAVFKFTLFSINSQK